MEDERKAHGKAYDPSLGECLCRALSHRAALARARVKQAATERVHVPEDARCRQEPTRDEQPDGQNRFQPLTSHVNICEMIQASANRMLHSMAAAIRAGNNEMKANTTNATTRPNSMFRTVAGGAPVAQVVDPRACGETA